MVSQVRSLTAPNDVRFYFLAGRPVASKWHEMYPGIATEQINQKIMVQDILRKHVRVIVRVDMPAPTDPNGARLGGDGTVLDEFISANYHRSSVIGKYELMLANEGQGIR